MNVLCGRSPLYRVEEFFRIRDVGLLLGEDMTAGMLNDDAIGRVLDRMYEYGTWKIFSEVCLQAFRNFGVDCSVVHQDTTSVSVWGEYPPAPGDPFRIVHGFSKDKRPDLKQFILSLLCVEGNLPCHARRTEKMALVVRDKVRNMGLNVNGKGRIFRPFVPGRVDARPFPFQ
jgi:transposase